jgi:DNA-directed RNA polymerase subunit H (RpoH/RPB5)
MSCNIPTICTQLRRARPIIKKMVRTRVGDTTLFQDEESDALMDLTQLLQPLYTEYIPQTGTLTHAPPFPFCDDDDEGEGDLSSCIAFPALCAYLTEAECDFTFDELKKIYRLCGIRRILVDFSQCCEENPQYIWMPTQRDNRFQLEMHTLKEHLTETARNMIMEQADALHKTLPDSVIEEAMTLFCQNYCKIYLFITRNTKASETLHEKYDKICTDVRETHGIHVQLFNLKTLMFDVTEHVLVPHHARLEPTFHTEEIRTIQKKYNVSSMAQFANISHLDPVARFIGLQENDLCKITRRNQTGGDFVYYRRCVHEQR